MAFLTVTLLILYLLALSAVVFGTNISKNQIFG